MFNVKEFLENNGRNEETKEVETMETITKYELRTARTETKKEYIYEGCTQTSGDICSEIIETFDNLEDALKAVQ